MQCTAPGFRNLGVEGFCLEHYTKLVTTFDAAAWCEGGIGLPGRTARTSDLTCTACGATWHGAPGDRCSWCTRALEVQREHTVDLLLRPPAARTARALEAWAARLDRAVAAGLLPADRAAAAVRREVNRAS